MENHFEVWAAMKELQWRRDWSHDPVLAPLIYRNDVLPYKLLARLVREKVRKQLRA
jgi:hypothetical protein